MKTKNRKKNDRAAFYNLPLSEYRAMSKRKRREWRKPDSEPISLDLLIGLSKHEDCDCISCRPWTT